MSDRIEVLITTIFIIIALWLIYRSFSEKYKRDDHPTLNEVSRRLSLLDERYGSIPLKKGNKSYTDNKKVIYLCLEDPKTKKEYSMNTIMYVAIHELTHVLNPEWDLGDNHGEAFKKLNEKLLRKSASIGIYDPRYPIPEDYCGL